MLPRRKQIGKGKSPGDIIQEETVVTNLSQLPKDLLEKILKKAPFSAAAAAVSSARFLKETLDLKEHPAFVTLLKKFSVDYNTGLIYAPVSRQIIYVKQGKDFTGCFYTYDASIEEEQQYDHSDNPGYPIKLYVSKDGSVILSKHPSIFSVKLWKWNAAEKKYEVNKTYSAEDEDNFKNTIMEELRDCSFRIDTILFSRIYPQSTITFSTDFQYVINTNAAFFSYNTINIYLHTRRQLIIIKDNNTISGFSVDNHYNVSIQTPVWEESIIPLSEDGTISQIHNIEVSQQETQFAILVSKRYTNKITPWSAKSIVLWDWPLDAVKPTVKHIIQTETGYLIQNNYAYSPNGSHIIFFTRTNHPIRERTPEILRNRPLRQQAHVWNIQANADEMPPFVLKYQDGGKSGKNLAQENFLLGFYTKDKKDHAMLLGNSGMVFSFTPSIPLIGGARSRRRGRPTASSASIAPTTQAQIMKEIDLTTMASLPSHVIRDILNRADLSSTAKAKLAAKIFNEAYPKLSEHPEFVSLLKEFPKTVYGELMYASKSQQLIYSKPDKDLYNAFYTYDVSTGKEQAYIHDEENHTKPVLYYVSDDGSVILTKRYGIDTVSIKVWRWNATEGKYKESQSPTTHAHPLRGTAYRISDVLPSLDDTQTISKLLFDNSRLRPVIVYPTTIESEPFRNFNAIYYFHTRRMLLLFKDKNITGYSVNEKYEVDMTPLWSKPFITLSQNEMCVVYNVELSPKGTQLAVFLAKYNVREGFNGRSIYIALWDWPEGNGVPTLKYELHNLYTGNQKDIQLSGNVYKFSPNGNYLVFVSQGDNKTYYLNVWDIEANRAVKDDSSIELKYKPERETVKKPIRYANGLGFYKKDNKDHILIKDATGMVFSVSPRVSLMSGGRRRPKSSK